MFQPSSLTSFPVQMKLISVTIIHNIAATCSEREGERGGREGGERGGEGGGGGGGGKRERAKFFPSVSVSVCAGLFDVCFHAQVFTVWYVHS